MNFAETKEFLLHTPIKQSVLIKGNHGIGKSELVKQVAKEMGGTCIDLRLSQNDVGDLKGMPFLVNGRTFFAPPNWFPLDAESRSTLDTLLKSVGQKLNEGYFGDKGILFLDEMNRATRECEQVAFELVLDRRLNFINIPEGWRVVSAINDDTDLYNANEMDPALLSRFAEINFRPTVDEWLEYAKEIGVHPSVVQFITKQEESLDVSSDTMKNPENRGKKMWDRRSWVRLAETIKSFEDADPKWMSTNSKYRVSVFQAFLGTTMAVKFSQFVENEYVVLSAKKILNEWDSEVERHLGKARVSELGGYNKLLVDFIGKDAKIQKDKKLSATQSQNLLKYIDKTPKEVGSDFWSLFNSELGEISKVWYDTTDKASTVILSRLQAPPSARKKPQ